MDGKERRGLWRYIRGKGLGRYIRRKGVREVYKREGGQGGI